MKSREQVSAQFKQENVNSVDDQAITWTNDSILSVGPRQKNKCDILYGNCRPSSFGISVLTHWGHHFPDDNLKRIFLNENVCISIMISLKFVHRGPINNIPELVQIMAWCRPGDKPLSEPVVVSLLTHICVTRPHWVKRSRWPGISHCLYRDSSWHISGQFFLLCRCSQWGMTPDSICWVIILTTCHVVNLFITVTS